MIRPDVSPELARWIADVGPLPWIAWAGVVVGCLALRGRR